MQKIYFSWILFISVFSNSFAQKYDFGCYIKDPQARYREHNLDFTKLNLDVRFAPKIGEVKGTAHYTFKVLNPHVDTLFLDAIDMKIEKVTIKNIGTLDFNTQKNGVTIQLKKILPPAQVFAPSKEYELDITYTAYPKKGLYFIGWNDTFNLAQKQIWSQGQGIDNRHWIPGYDDQNDKLITGLTVHFEKSFEVISNGLFKEVIADPANPQEKIWKFEMTQPHSLYLIMLAIGHYKYKDLTSKSGVVSRQYYYPERESSFNSTYQYSNEMMNWMEDEIKIPYAWNKFYRNVPVQDFIFGAMENTMATIFTDLYHQNPQSAFERNYVATNAHELAHQWFGDLITAWSGTHHWLHESFATHYSKHFMKHQFGQEEFEKIRLEELWSSIEADKGNNFPIAHSEAGSPKHYPKGSLVLDMLRYVLGNDNYRRSIEAYLKKHSYRNVDSHDLYISIMETTGINLDWFFDEWVYRGSNPTISTSYTTEKGKITFNCQQKIDSSPELKPFKMPVELEVFYKDRTKDSSVRWISKLSDTFIIENKENKEVAFILFDGRNQIIKRYQPNRTYESIVEQAQRAPYAIAKYEAINALADTAISKKKAILLEAFVRETFLPSKTNIIAQLGKDTLDVDIQNFLLQNLSHSNHIVRRESLNQIKIDNDYEKKAAMKMLKDTSFVNCKIALEKLAKTYPGEYLQYVNLTRPVAGFNKNVEITRHKLIIQNSKTLNAHIDSLIFFASPSFEFRTRVNAIEALSDLDIINAKYLPVIFEAYLNANNRLSGPASTALRKYLKSAENKNFIEAFTKRMNWSDFQKEKLKALFEN